MWTHLIVVNLKRAKFVSVNLVSSNQANATLTNENLAKSNLVSINSECCKCVGVDLLTN